MAVCAGCLASVPDMKARDVVAEEGAISVSEFLCDNTDRHFQSWRNNWFLQFGAGINQPFVERGIGVKSPGKDVNRHIMTVTYNFGVGHWFSPYLAMRLNALGGVLHWNNPTRDQPGNGRVSARHVNLNAELMWDMCNSFAGVNPDRVFSVIPFVGVGGDYTWHIEDRKGKAAAASNIILDGRGEVKTSSWTLPVTAGFQLRLRLCRYVDFFAEARASFYGDNWNGCSYGKPIEANVACLGGFNINIGGRTWDSYNECSTLASIAQLNNEVNNLRAENMAAMQTIASLESQLPCPEPEPQPVVQKDYPKTPLLTTVRFMINSDKIMPSEEINIYNMAQWLKANPKERIVIAGYADRDTGSSDYNLELSKKRAEAVAGVLVGKYGINANRLVVKYDGSDVQPYGTNDWNRIVIFSQK